MKKIILLFAGILFTSTVMAQGALSKFFQRYEDDTSFTLINISPRMFSMFSKVQTGDKESQQVIDVARKLTGLKILTKDNARNGMQLFREANTLLSKDFEELMSVRDQGNDMKFLVKQTPDGHISELVMLVGGSSDFLALSLTGNISLDEISKISKDMNISGFDKLGNIKQAKK